METLKKWYVAVAVICFTVAFPIRGRTPLQWGFYGAQTLMNLAGPSVRSLGEVATDVGSVVEEGAQSSEETEQ